MKSRNSRPAPCQSSASAPRFASFSTWSGKAGAPMRSPSSAGTSTPVQPRFGATSRRPALSTRPGSAIVAPAVTSPCSPVAATASPASCARSPRTSSTGRPRLSTATSAAWRCWPARSAARVGEEVDADLQPEAHDAVPAELDGQRGPADGAAQLDLGLAHEAELDQLADEARHRRLVQPRLLGDRGARARSPVGDVAEHDAQVVPAHRALVGRSVAEIVVGHGATLTGAGAARNRCPRANAQPRRPPSSCSSRRSPASSAAAAVTSSSVSACASQPVRSRRSSRDQRGDLGGDLEPLRRPAVGLAVVVEDRQEPAGLVALREVVRPVHDGDRLAALQQQLSGAIGVRRTGEAGHVPRVLPHPGRFHPATSVECIRVGEVRRVSRAQSSHRVAGAPWSHPAHVRRPHAPAAAAAPSPAVRRLIPRRARRRPERVAGAARRLERRAARLAGRPADLVRRVGLARGGRRRGAPLEPLRRARAALRGAGPGERQRRLRRRSPAPARALRPALPRAVVEHRPPARGQGHRAAQPRHHGAAVGAERVGRHARARPRARPAPPRGLVLGDERAGLRRRLPFTGVGSAQGPLPCGPASGDVAAAARLYGRDEAAPPCR